MLDGQSLYIRSQTETSYEYCRNVPEPTRLLTCGFYYSHSKYDAYTQILPRVIHTDHFRRLRHIYILSVNINKQLNRPRQP